MAARLVSENTKPNACARELTVWLAVVTATHSPATAAAANAAERVWEAVGVPAAELVLLRVTPLWDAVWLRLAD